MIPPALRTWCRNHQLTVVSLVAWLTTRLYLLSAAAGVDNDPTYYFTSLRDAADGWQTLREYPVAAVGLMRGLNFLAGADLATFRILFLLVNLACDLAFVWLLLRQPSPWRHLAVWVWIVGVACLGGFIMYRFDLIPATLAAGAVLLLVGRDAAGARRSAAAGALLALAISLKLWPAALVPVLWAAARRRLPFLAGLTASLAILTTWAVAVAGGERFLSALTNQGERGLQIESVWATPVQLLRYFDPGAAWAEWEFGAIHLHGTLVGPMLALSTAATALGGAYILALAWQLARRRPPATAALASLVTVLIVVASSAVFSAQFVIWALPLASLALVVAGPDDCPAGGVRQCLAARRNYLLGAGGLVVLAWFTGWLYPVVYDDFLAFGPTPIQARGLLVLLVRNVLFAGLTGYLAVLTWRQVAAEPQPSANIGDTGPGPGAAGVEPTAVAPAAAGAEAGAVPEADDGAAGGAGDGVSRGAPAAGRPTTLR
ncbi:DUF2029 domain-containing protein [Buchananella hordeovulneris]|uniref:glycosyltransferase 87 family protein n=1 Tax=Buchananella hordeovulneris TaxID=52770 RepID=UPI000F5ECCD7|nr:glycosyltransferase 87 family protein [Buchananella hordeovulneris]RRD49808.1 DUF2029 domain-containing protein [Buchananella hordeovulneris]